MSDGLCAGWVVWAFGGSFLKRRNEEWRKRRLFERRVAPGWIVWGFLEPKNRHVAAHGRAPCVSKSLEVDQSRNGGNDESKQQPVETTRWVVFRLWRHVFTIYPAGCLCWWQNASDTNRWVVFRSWRHIFAIHPVGRLLPVTAFLRHQPGGSSLHGGGRHGAWARGREGASNAPSQANPKSPACVVCPQSTTRSRCPGEPRRLIDGATRAAGLPPVP